MRLFVPDDVRARAVGRDGDPARAACVGRRAEVAAVDAEARDPLVAGVGDVERAGGVDRERGGVEHPARAAALRADRARRQAGRAVEDDDPRAALVEDVGVAGGVEDDGDRVGQDRRAGRGGAPDGGERAVGREQLDAAVDGVGDRAVAVGVGGDAERRVELPGRAARLAEGAQERAGAVEDVDAVVAGVRDEDLAVGVDGERARVGELAGAGAVGAPARLVGVLRLRAEAHDAVVDVVGDEDAALRVDADAEREAQLVLARALAAADRLQEAPAGVVDGEPVVVVVGDDQPRAADRQAARVVELPGGDQLGGVGAVELDALDAVVEAVGHEQRLAEGRQPAACGRVVAAAGAEVKLPDLRAAAAEGVDQLAGRVEAVDAVAAVGDEQRVVAGDGERADRSQLARARTGDADLALVGAVLGEDLDDVRRLVADVDRAVGPDRDRLREAQDALAALADLRAGDVRAGRIGAGAVGGGGRRGQRDRAQHGERGSGAQPPPAPAGSRTRGH